MLYIYVLIGWQFLYFSLQILLLLAFCMWQTYNEVQHCFLIVVLVYPEDLFGFLLNVVTISLLESYSRIIALLV